jgi:Rnl2 family RNA ligase
MFVPYDKMEERWEADPEAHRALARERWVVTEKIHGANFVVVGEPDGRVRFAKRKELLAPGESFFGHEVLVARIGSELVRALSLGRELFGGEATILVYGELFGGHYPHPAVAPVPGLSAVQTGVWYSPRLEYCAFDLAAVRADGTREMAACDDALALFRSAGLFAAEPLFTGSLAEASRFPVERSSAIPARLGLPPLDQPNLAEGVVIKSNRAWAIGGALVRPAFKRKIAAFAEDERYQGAEKPAGSPRDSGDALGALLELASALINPPRAAAARSKIGALDDDARRRRAIETIREEVLEELARRAPDSMAALTPPDRALLVGQIELMAEFVLG